MATRVLIALLVASGTAFAQPAELGKAFTAYERGDLAAARGHLAKLDLAKITNKDYVLWLRGTIALRTDDPAAARTAFEALGKIKGSRFGREVPWRLADCLWAKGDRAGAAKAYAKLIPGKTAGEDADVGTALYRIAETRTGAAAASGYRALLLGYPAHPLAARAEQQMLALGGASLTASERIARAQRLTDAHLWDEAVAELALVSDDQPTAVLHQRDYWLGTTLFKMRRRYGDSGRLLLAVYPYMGGSAAEAMFHGARALSRADQDDEAIQWYRKVVATYPRTPWAEEAAYLAGWLEFNRGKYREAIAPLEDSLARYPRSKWVDDALWNLGLAHYFLGENDKARARLDALAKRGGALEGGKGRYWLARLDEKLLARDAAIAGYTEVVTKFPFSWYALLSRSRLAKLGVTLGPFGATADPKPRGPKLDATLDPALASDELIARADELIAAGLVTDAGEELARGEQGFLKRHDRASALATLLERYRKAANYYQPWNMSENYKGSALDGPPEGDARRWWEIALPRAYQPLIEKHQKLGDNPAFYLYSIMRKESGFNPHDLSYADAQGLLQMIPPTTRRVAKELGLPYDEGRLYDPEYNIQTGSWYIGRLLQKFKGQIPIGAGSFNSGPRPVMRWLDLYGDREIDELVELVPFTQTREYMKKVTENYARYLFLYDNKIYEQPLTVDKKYVQDRLTY